MSRVLYTNRFIDNLAQVHSESLLVEIDSVLALLESFPELGSSNVRSTLKERFGNNLRKFPISSFLIVYRYDDNADTFEILALPHAAGIA